MKNNELCICFPITFFILLLLVFHRLLPFILCLCYFFIVVYLLVFFVYFFIFLIFEFNLFFFFFCLFVTTSLVRHFHCYRSFETFGTAVDYLIFFPLIFLVFIKYLKYRHTFLCQSPLLHSICLYELLSKFYCHFLTYDNLSSSSVESLCIAE